MKRYLGTAMTVAAACVVLWGGNTLAGQDSYPNVYDQSMNRSEPVDVGDPVSAGNGSYHFTMPLLDLGGPLPLAYSISYRYDQVASGEFPKNFQGSTSIELRYDDNVGAGNDTMVNVKLMDGRIIAFRKDPTTGEWELTDNTPLRYELRETGTDYEHGWYYFMDPAAGLVYMLEKTDFHWANISRPVHVMDRNGNTWTYTYSTTRNRITPDTITDGRGRSLTFNYSNGYLQRVTDQAGRQVDFTLDITADDYNNWTVLRSVTDADGQTTTFHYTFLPALSWQAPIVRVEHPRGNSPYSQTPRVITLNGYDNIRVEEQTDLHDNTMAFAYDEATNRVTVTNPDTSVESFGHFDNAGLPREMRDAEGNAFTFTQTSRGQAESLTDKNGKTRRMTYHAESGKLASREDAEGHVTQYAYQAQEQTFTNPTSGETVTFTFYDLQQITYPDGTTRSFTRDPRGNVLTMTDRNGKVWRFTYNAMGLVETVTNPLGGVVTRTYNADGTVASVTDSDTGSITFEYDAAKRPVKINYPDGTDIRITWSNTDRITEVTDRNGVRTRVEYDANNNPVRRTRALGTTLEQVFAYTYDDMDRLTQVTDPLGSVTRFDHTWWGDVRRVTNPDGTHLDFTFNTRRWLTSITDEAGKTTTIGRDDNGWPLSFTSPEGHTASRTLDGTGEMISATDAMGKSYLFERDAMGRIVRITDRLNRQTTIGRDNEGRITSATLPVIGTVSYTRNDLGLVSTLRDQRGKDWHFTYTQMGRLATVQDPLGHTWTYGYDTSGRLATITAPDGVTETRTYDGNGNLLQRAFSDGLTLSYTYDQLNRVTHTGSVPVDLTYDKRDQVTRTTIHGMDFDAAYDVMNRLQTVTYGGQMTVTYTYDARGLLARVTDSLTGSWLEFTYDGDRRLTQIRRSNGIDTQIQRDANGRITRITHAGKGDLQITLNAEGDITSVMEDLPIDVASLLSAETRQYQYDDANQITTSGFGYDERGRRTKDPLHTYTWDSADRLTGLSHEGTDVTLDYTASGEVGIRTVGTAVTKFCYNYAIAGRPIVAEMESGAFVRFYVHTPSGRLLYYVDLPSTPCFYHFNQTGNTLFLTDKNGNITDSYGYTPYGRLLKHEGSSTQPFTYVGEYGVRQEGDSGIYHMRARYYDAWTGRFISRDPIWPELAEIMQSNGSGTLIALAGLSLPATLGSPRAANPYHYAAQNPLRFIDPTGLMTQRESERFGRIANYLSSQLEAIKKDFFKEETSGYYDHTVNNLENLVDAVKAGYVKKDEVKERLKEIKDRIGELKREIQRVKKEGVKSYSELSYCETYCINTDSPFGTREGCVMITDSLLSSWQLLLAVILLAVWLTARWWIPMLTRQG